MSANAGCGNGRNARFGDFTLAISCALLVGLVGSLTVTLVAAIPLTPWIVIGIGAQFSCAAASLALSLARTRGDFFAPAVAFNVFFLLGYPVALLFVVADRSVVLNLRFSVHGDLAASIEAALVCSTLGWLSFLIGSLVATGGRRGQPTSSAPQQRLVWSGVVTRVLASSLIGVAAVAYLVVALGGLDLFLAGLSSRVRAFEGLNYFAQGAVIFGTGSLSLHLALRSESRPSRRLLVVAHSMFALGLLAMNGSKTNVLYFVMAAACIRHYRYRAVSGSRVVALVVATAVFYVAYDVYFREFAILGYVLHDPYRQGLSASFFGSIGDRLLAGSFIQSPTLMVIMDTYPGRHGFHFGETFLSLVLAPLPRGLFPDKPISPAGLFTEVCNPEFFRSGSTMPPSLMGEFFMNFGTVGAIAGMFAFGWLFGRLYRALLNDRGSPWRIGHYALTWAAMLPWIRGESFGPTILYITASLTLHWILHGNPLRAQPARSISKGLRP